MYSQSHVSLYWCWPPSALSTDSVSISRHFCRFILFCSLLTCTWILNTDFFCWFTQSIPDLSGLGSGQSWAESKGPQAGTSTYIPLNSEPSYSEHPSLPWDCLKALQSGAYHWVSEEEGRGEFSSSQWLWFYIIFRLNIKATFLVW